MGKPEKNMVKNNSYYMRLVYAFALLVLLMLVICSVMFRVSRENVLSIGHLNAVQMGQNLRYYLVEESDEIALAAHTVEIMQDMGRSNEDILEYLTFESRIVNETIDENYTGLYGYINGEYMDGSGWVPDEDYNPKERPWYQGATAGNGRVIYITPYVDSETGTVMMSICKMLADRKSVVSLDVSLDRIQDIVSSDYFSQYDQVIVTDKNHVVVAALDPSLRGEDISDNLLIEAHIDSGKNNNSDGYYTYRANSGIKYAVFSTSVEEQWDVFLIIRSGELTRSLLYIFVILIAGTLAFAVFVAVAFDYLNKRRKSAENLSMQLESIADIYVSVHRFDLEHDTIEEVRSLPYVRELRRTAEQTSVNSRQVLEKVMKALTRDEHWEDMKAFLDMDTLDVRSGSSNTLSIEFLGIHGWMKARIIILERKNDKISSFLWMVENIDEEKRKQNELRYLSETDLMTGLRNRGCGERLIKEQLAAGNNGMFCLMDADQFKSINDHYGHDVGDTVIKAIAECLRGSFATGDIVLRLGGDEFAAFAAGIGNEEQAGGILERFIHALDQLEIPGLRGERKIELSIGASFVTAGQRKDFKTLYREADRAAYRSKKTAGSCVTFYRAETDR